MKNDKLFVYKIRLNFVMCKYWITKLREIEQVQVICDEGYLLEYFLF